MQLPDDVFVVTFILLLRTGFALLSLEAWLLCCVGALLLLVVGS